MVNQIAVLGGFTVALCMCFLLVPELSSQFRAAEGDLCLLTAFFALFIFTSVFNCFNARTDRLKLFAGLSKNSVFVLGDNRNDSWDSRSKEIGQIDCREVLGQAIFIAFPAKNDETQTRDFSRIGGL
jgi:hypothetical protein